MRTHGDAQTRRTLKWGSWDDSYSILEDTNSKEFNQAITNETHIWNASQKPNITKWKKLYKQLFEAAIPDSPDYSQDIFVWNNTKIALKTTYSHRINCYFDNQLVHEDITFFNYDKDSNNYLIIKDIGTGSELLEIQVYSLNNQTTKIWKHSPVGPSAAFQNKQLYYLGVENHLRYNSVQCIDQSTYTKTTTVYNISDKKFQLELNQLDDTIFIRKSNALNQIIGHIENNKLEWITLEHNEQLTTLIPISKSTYGTNTSIMKNTTRIELPHNQFLESAKYIDGNLYIITLSNMKSNLYILNENNVWKPLYDSKMPNSIYFNMYSNTLVISFPNKGSIIYEIKYKTQLKPILEMPTPLQIHFFKYGFAKSKDGKNIPYTIVASTKNPKKLIVDAYGAYGIVAHRNYPIRWLPWINKDYAYSVIACRGGRDNGDAWYNEARTAPRKHNTFDDTAAAVAHIQKQFNISPTKTVLYGRSAGGWTVAAVTNNHPNLLGASIAEVPYVDVLRTTSNPSLPLTQLEYDEFGDPIHKKEDYLALKVISPVDTIKQAPKHSPSILVKTALNDVQVLPYEALKYTQKLRKHNWDVVCAIDKNGGHFAESKSYIQQLSEDAAYIDNVLGKEDKSARRMSRKLRSHVSKGITRRLHNSRKQATKQATSPSAL